MKGLVFGTTKGSWEAPDRDDPLLLGLARAPVNLVEVREPKRPAVPGWVPLRVVMCGICGSDIKQVCLDLDPKDVDNPLSSLISFPHVLGHEIVAEVALDTVKLAAGTRVVVNPWLSCCPRGVTPLCMQCVAGNFSLCSSFLTGPISPGIHLGNCRDLPGGFAPMVWAHESMLIPVSDGVSDRDAVLADPFAVALRAVVRNPPPSSGRALIYGAGTLGLLSATILRCLHPGVEVGVVARFPHQHLAASELGAKTFSHEPRADLVVAVCEWMGARSVKTWASLPWTINHGVDIVYDTVGAPETIEVALRVVRPAGSVVKIGVTSPGRCEWTPLYFKEVSLVGSNASGIEALNGTRRHGMAYYLDLVASGEVAVSHFVTHVVSLDRWREAFTTAITANKTSAIKVAISPIEG